MARVRGTLSEYFIHLEMAMRRALLTYSLLFVEYTKDAHHLEQKNTVFLQDVQ